MSSRTTRSPRRTAPSAARTATAPSVPRTTVVSAVSVPRTVTALVIVLAVTALRMVTVLVVVRPVARRHMLTRPTLLTNTEALEGKRALVTEQVDERDGRVKIGGDVWSARTLDPGEVIEAGAEVTVVQIDGATAVVWRG